MKKTTENISISICGIFLLMTASRLLVGCHKNNGQAVVPIDTTTVNNPPPPKIVQTDTLFGNGVDLQPSYYNGGNVTFGFALMQQYPNIKSVRIEIEPSVPIPLATSWIKKAIDSGYRVIATYHKYTVLGSDDVG